MREALALRLDLLESRVQVRMEIGELKFGKEIIRLIPFKNPPSPKWPAIGPLGMKMMGKFILTAINGFWQLKRIIIFGQNGGGRRGEGAVRD